MEWKPHGRLVIGLFSLKDDYKTQTQCAHLSIIESDQTAKRY